MYFDVWVPSPGYAPLELEFAHHDQLCMQFCQGAKHTKSVLLADNYFSLSTSACKRIQDVCITQCHALPVRILDL